jgi:hypothetical protein
MLVFSVVITRGLVGRYQRFGVTLKMKVVCSSESLVYAYNSTRRYTPEGQYRQEVELLCRTWTHVDSTLATSCTSSTYTSYNSYCTQLSCDESTIVITSDSNAVEVFKVSGLPCSYTNGARCEDRFVVTGRTVAFCILLYVRCQPGIKSVLRARLAACRCGQSEPVNGNQLWLLIYSRCFVFSLLLTAQEIDTSCK